MPWEAIVLPVDVIRPWVERTAGAFKVGGLSRTQQRPRNDQSFGQTGSITNSDSLPVRQVIQTRMVR